MEQTLTDNTLKKVAYIEDINKKMLLLYGRPLSIEEFDKHYDLPVERLYAINENLEGEICRGKLHSPETFNPTDYGISPPKINNREGDEQDIERPIYEWLSLIPDEGARFRALIYTGSHQAYKKAKNAREALRYAFDWSTTPEGHLYWEQVYAKL